MIKDKVIASMPGRNHRGDKSMCIGQFTIDYSKDDDKFYLVYPSGHVRELSTEEAAKYLGVKE